MQKQSWVLKQEIYEPDWKNDEGAAPNHERVDETGPKECRPQPTREPVNPT